MGNLQGDTVPRVLTPEGGGHLPLSGDLGLQAGRQGHDPVFASFGTADAQDGPLQVNVLDAEVQRFG
jgi:hypothetical protein